MKKIIVLLCLAAMAAVMFVGCKIGSCDICGDKGILSKKSVLGYDVYVCSDCGG